MISFVRPIKELHMCKRPSMCTQTRDNTLARALDAGEGAEATVKVT
jgi:hypothetical protein